LFVGETIGVWVECEFVAVHLTGHASRLVGERRVDGESEASYNVMEGKSNRGDAHLTLVSVRY